MADLNGALEQLNNTITGITGKVNEQKSIVTNYKTTLRDKLTQLMTSINTIKNNPKWKEIDSLRQQLQQLPELQKQLETKTSELNETKATIQDLQNQIQRLEQDIESKNNEITNLTNTGKEKDKAIQELDEQARELDKQKEEIQKNLTAKTQEMNGLAERIKQIINALGNQIGNINQIANELGDLQNPDDPVVQQFNAITDNIQIIIDILDGKRTVGAEATAQVEQEFEPDIEQLYNKMISVSKSMDQADLLSFYTYLNNKGKGSSSGIIQGNIKEYNNPESIKKVKSELTKLKGEGVPLIFGQPVRGGKRRRKTMKKRNRRTRKKMRGGYIYSSSKELDKASSVVSASSGSKSKKRRYSRRS